MSTREVCSITYDVLILGSGPAGLSAALQCSARGKTALVIGNPPQTSLLAKAELVDNYLGLPNISGSAMIDAFCAHAAKADGVSFVEGRALTAMSMSGSFYVSVGSDVYQGRAVILASGVARARPYPGEQELLGKGVSYCATCDGMLYRGRDIAVIGLAQDAAEEAAMLAKIGCRVTFVAPRRPDGLDDAIPFIKAAKLSIIGTEKVEGILADDQTVPCEGVFLLRDTVAPTALFPGLATENGYIQVDRTMATNLPGVFAAGDCTGLPLQVSKAVGEGQTAAHFATQWLDAQNKQIHN